MQEVANKVINQWLSNQSNHLSSHNWRLYFHMCLKIPIMHVTVVAILHNNVTAGQPLCAAGCIKYCTFSCRNNDICAVGASIATTYCEVE